MTNQKAIRLIRNLPTMCEFTDAYGEPIDSEAYYEAVNMAISALQALDTISRQAAIDAIEKNAYRHTYLYQIIDIVSEVPPTQPIDQEEPHRCINCYYGGRPTYKFPCCSCDNSNKWESLRRDKNEKD